MIWVILHHNLDVNLHDIATAAKPIAPIYATLGEPILVEERYEKYRSRYTEICEASVNAPL